MAASASTSLESFQRIIERQEALVNKIFGTSSDRLYAMQIMCFILLNFHTVKSTSNTFESHAEDLLGLNLKDIIVGKVLGESESSLNLWVRIGRGRNLRVNARDPFQRDESTFVGFPTNIAEDLAFDAPTWLISYLFLRGVFKEPFKTMADVLDCKLYQISIDPTKQAEPLFPAWNEGGSSMFDPIERQTLDAANRAVRYVSEYSGAPFERLENVKMRWPKFAIGARDLSISVALKTPSTGKSGTVYLLPMDHRSRTVDDAWDEVKAAVASETVDKGLMSRAYEAVLFLLAAYEGNISPPSAANLKRKANGQPGPMARKKTKLAAGSVPVNQGGGLAYDFDACMHTIQTFNKRFPSSQGLLAGRYLEDLLGALDSSKVEEFHQIDARQEVLSNENMAEGLDRILRCLLGPSMGF